MARHQVVGFPQHLAPEECGTAAGGGVGSEPGRRDGQAEGAPEPAATRSSPNPVTLVPAGHPPAPRTTDP
ncbi:hypothetical protein ACFVFN_36195, partial [Streptomyces pharetrae]